MIKTAFRRSAGGRRSDRRRSLCAALAIGGLAAVVQGFAASPASAAGLDQLRLFLTETRSARGVFTQKVLRANGQALESTQGAFAFARPGKFRWEVRKPFEQLMVADGERLWFHDKDLNQVTIQKLGAAMGATPAAILFGTAEIDKAFTLSELGEREGLEWIEALPKNADQGFDRIAIGLRNGLPEAMEVRDAFGRTSVFAFAAIERNPELAASLFRFSPPAGADVIEQK
ncbi:outer membrane lipoprotein chaperone LolA [Burkholderiaceae bacterium FT117]|uniref:outer membrane lipoprotein chaperone LolA n=1 Tax=Zeimonas sediminis TaxID=2944268 RepID=UPI002342C2B6|nr:outer membrane lipoprotein chaperone LolA [Zeimonas sediminis]MCM5569360.1 outer membrane lipoprotein chaperone LolA [Zeimonas sediminis]